MVNITADAKGLSAGLRAAAATGKNFIVDLPAVGLSTLSGHEARLMGFCYQKHPRRGQWRLQLCVYQLLGTDRFPVTLSQLHKRDCKPADMHLGSVLPAEVLLLFVQREFAGGPWSVVQRIVREGFTGGVWTFLEGAPDESPA